MYRLCRTLRADRACDVENHRPERSHVVSEKRGEGHSKNITFKE